MKKNIFLHGPNSSDKALDNIKIKKESDEGFPLPGGTYVVGLEDESLKQTASGLILAGGRQNTCTYSHIIKTGAEQKKMFILENGKTRFLKEGDLVMHNTYVNTAFTRGGKTYMVINELDIYCLVPTAKESEAEPK